MLWRGAVGKQPVIGLYDRNGKVAGTVVTDTDSGTLHSVINANVRKGTTIYTDGHRGYHGLVGYTQDEVCHSVGEYVRGKAHTNGIESFWSLLKRGYIGTFHHMSPKHLQKYVNEFASRQSMRRCDTIDAMAITTKAGVGKSLSWKELTYEPAYSHKANRTDIGRGTASHGHEIALSNTWKQNKINRGIGKWAIRQLR